MFLKNFLIKNNTAWAEALGVGCYPQNLGCTNVIMFTGNKATKGEMKRHGMEGGGMTLGSDAGEWCAGKRWRGRERPPR